jgi:RNA-directed DNA polymerase
MQTLVKQALEPEWEAKFEPNSYGFRPGRSIHDAIGAIFLTISRKPKYVLDADIEKCFDRINWKALVKKLNAIQPIARLRAWLKAGVVDGNRLLSPEAGTPQGGPLSPLLCNVALHGLERDLAGVSKRHRISVIRYADDLVALCENLETLQKVRQQAETWLAQMGLRLKPSKTRVTHTLRKHEGQVGFDFLGFNVRQYWVGKHRTYTYRAKPGFKTLIKPSKEARKRHLQKVGRIIRQHRGAPQIALIAALNPVIRGWAQNYRTCVAKKTFAWMDYQVYFKLYQWARYRHPKKTSGWRHNRYWKRQGKRFNFGSEAGWKAVYADTPIVRHIKVRGDKSPYDGDWLYWVKRLGRDPTKPKRVVKLLKRDSGLCMLCGLCFKAEDVIEVHHWDGDSTNNRYTNLTLLHAHCHDQIHSNGICDKDPRFAEERREAKASRAVR